MRKNLVVALFIVVWLTVTVFVLGWGFYYNLTYFAHVNYGVPLTWATNELMTLAGPGNLWSVNIWNLLIDIVFWFGIMIIIVAALLYKLKPQGPQRLATIRTYNRSLLRSPL